MLDKDKIIHDLALIYAKSKFESVLSDASDKQPFFIPEVSILRTHYQNAVIALIAGFDGIDESYKEE